MFIENTVTEYKGRQVPTLGKPAQYLARTSPKGQLKPFHAAIIPAEILRINQFERGFSTSLGTTFEECARLVARQHHRQASRGYDIQGEASRAATQEIDRQVAVFEHATERGAEKPSLDEMVAAVLDARRTDDLELRTARADLFVLARDGAQFLFEMKSPKPNRGQCLEVIQRLLRFHLLRGGARPKVSAYFAMAYNPYGPTRADYRWSFARNYLPFEQATLIGREFWELVGGPTTYDSLLAIYQEVGREKTKYMIDALAFGF